MCYHEWRLPVVPRGEIYLTAGIPKNEGHQCRFSTARLASDPEVGNSSAEKVLESYVEYPHVRAIVSILDILESLTILGKVEAILQLFSGGQLCRLEVERRPRDAIPHETLASICSHIAKRVRILILDGSSSVHDRER